MPKADCTIIARLRVDSGLLSVNSVDNPAPGAQNWMDIGLPSLSWTAFGMIGFSYSIRWGTDAGPGYSGAPGSIDFVEFLTMTLPSGPLSSFTQTDSGLIATLASLGSISHDLEDGAITVTLTAEEVEETITDSTFPSTFGTSIAHGPKKTTKYFRQRVKLGTDIVISANIGGRSIVETIPIDTTGKQFYLDNLDNAGTPDWVGYSLSQSGTHRSLPIGGTVAIESELEIDGNVVALSCPFSGSDHGHSVGGASISATAPGGTRGSDIHRTVAASQIWVPREWELYTYFRAMEDAYPGSVDMRVDRKAGDTNHLISAPVDGTLADSEEQKRYTATGNFSDSSYAGGPFVGDETQSSSGVEGIAWSTSGITQPTALNVNEYQDFQTGLDNAFLLAQQEETEDWRCLIQLGASEDVGSLTHEEEYEVDIGTSANWDADNAETSLSDSGGYIEIAASGGEGSASLTFALPDREYPPADDWQAGLELVLVLQYDTPGQPFKVTVNDTEQNKEWEDGIGTEDVDETFTFDLRAPWNAPDPTDSTQSRYYEEGWLFGVNKAVSVRFSDIPDGTTLRVKSITIKRRDRSRVNFGLPTRPWLPSNVGPNYLRHVFAESYKVVLEIPGQREEGGSHTYPTLSDFFQNLADFHPGWSAVNSASAAQLLKPLMWLGGIHGAYWNGGGFVNSIDVDARTAADIALAEGADVIRWYPMMGEIRGAYGVVTPMRVGKVLRGWIEAVVIDPTTHEGANGVDVQFSGGASAAETEATDANGWARSEPRKFGSGTAQVGGNSVSVSVWNRWVAWSGFTETGDEGCTSGLSMDFSPGLRFVRACNEDNTIRLHFAIDAGRIVFESIDTGIEADVQEVRWERLSAEMRLFLSYIDGDGLLWMTKTASEGNSFSMPVQLSTEVVTQQTKAIGENKIVYSYWRTDAGALKGKLLNFADETLLPRPDETALLADGFEVIASNVEDVDIACAVAPGEAGQFVVKLGYYGPDGLTQVSSTDGRVFT